MFNQINQLNLLDNCSCIVLPTPIHGLVRTTNALNLQDFLEHFELTLLCILHPRYNSIPAENRMGDTFSLKITDKVSYIQHLDLSRYDSTDLFRFNVEHVLYLHSEPQYFWLLCSA